MLEGVPASATAEVREAALVGDEVREGVPVSTTDELGGGIVVVEKLDSTTSVARKVATPPAEHVRPPT